MPMQIVYDLYNIDINHFTHNSGPRKKSIIINNKKICQQCDQEKDAYEDFYWSNGYARNICKECVKINERQRYQQIIETVNNYKKKLQCRKCGEKRFYLLDFHHRNPEEKDFNISDKSRVPLEKLQIEINKCDVLCANCHREWHYLAGHQDINYENWLNGDSGSLADW